MRNSDEGLVPQSEHEFEQAMVEALADADEPFGGSAPSVSTFAESGVLTNNRGLVVTLENGATFQVTIVQSDGFADDEDDDEDEDDGSVPEHEHSFGPFEESRVAGTWHRKCTFPGCWFVSLDGEDDEEVVVESEDA